MKTFNENLAALIVSVAKELSKTEDSVQKLSFGQANLTDYITADNQYMNTETGNDYTWYETDILLNDFLDEECDGSIAELVNIFQTVEQVSKTSFDTKVFKFQHFADGRNIKDSTLGFWIENYALHMDEIKVSYKDAFKKIQEVNLPKPHSRHVCLRNPIGPKECNPQWIFGNIQSQIWVDAVTGEVRESNPAFPD